MFPSRFVLFVGLAMVFSVAGLAFHHLGGAGLVAVWVAAAATLLGVLLLRDGHPQLRSTGASLMGVALCGFLVAVFAVPAHASAAVDLVWRGSGLASDLVALPSDTLQLIAAPAGDTGFWGAINGWVAPALGSALTALVAWAVALFTKRTGIQITAAREASLRETMRTGLFQTVHELEIAIDDHWTPAQRQKIVDRVVAWAQARAATELKKLGLPSFVVNAMASKVIGEVQLGLGLGTVDAGISTSVFTGNPGETPALDRAAGGNGGN